MENLLVILVVAVLLGIEWTMVRDLGREHDEPLDQTIFARADNWGDGIHQGDDGHTSMCEWCLPDIPDLG